MARFVHAARPVVAVAGEPALLAPRRSMRDALTAVGAAIATVDLTTDRTLPPGTVAVVLGDGAPRPHAVAISANQMLRDAVVDAHRAGIPVIAEGAGVAYLAESLDGHPMCDLLPVVAGAGRGGVPAVVELRAAGDGPLYRADERCWGRPSAAIALDVGAGVAPAWTIGPRREGWASPGLHASLVVAPWSIERARRLLDEASVRSRVADA